MSSELREHKTSRTLYLHTLDGQPASYQYHEGGGISYLATYMHARFRIKPALSLAQIRREQNECCETVAAEHGDPQAYLARCGYVLLVVGDA